MAHTRQLRGRKAGASEILGFSSPRRRSSIQVHRAYKFALRTFCFFSITRSFSLLFFFLSPITAILNVRPRGRCAFWSALDSCATRLQSEKQGAI